jgi:two-component system OmpR family sensor kinase
MKRAPSALVAIGGFGVAVAALSVATTAAIVLVAPPPPAIRMTAIDAISALRQPVVGFERRVEQNPPEGTRISIVELLIASRLGKPARDVRVTRLDSAAPVSVRFQMVPRTSDTPISTTNLPSSFILRQGRSGKIEIVEPGRIDDALSVALLAMPLPAYAASVRQADGRWLVIEPHQPLLGGWQRSILIALAVSLLLLAPLAWIFARRLTRPFRALAGALENDAAEIPEAGPRELREAAAAIAAMQSRLAIEAAERARMLTAIAHDLRTPLTGLRVRIESAPEPQRARMVADVERMQAMIDEVLAFARDAASPAEIVDVRTLLAGIVVEMSRSDAPIRLVPGDDATVRVPEPAFRRAVENLVRNAIDYAGGGSIALRQAEGHVHISVSDTGPGVPATDRERLMRPFERGDASRNRGTGGAGLGLSIVRDFVTQNRGDFTLNDAPGGGAIATLSLPSA